MTLGLGLVGCGNIAGTYLDLAPLFSGIEVRAVADINVRAAQSRAAAYGVRAETVDALMSADDIDIVVNLTIPDAHYRISKQALEAGKHVYSEKPFVLSVTEGIELHQIAERRGVRLGSSPDTFLGGAHQQARGLIDAGDIGDVISGTCHRMGPSMESWHPNPDFFFSPGAGPVLDICPYYIANLVQLIGPVARVQAVSSTPSATRTIGNGARKGEVIPVTTPTTFHAILEFQSGAAVTLGTSWDIWAHRHGHMELYGTKGSLFLPDPNFFGGVVERGEMDGSVTALPQSDHPFHVVNDGAEANFRTAGCAEMARAIVDGQPHRCNSEFALHVVDVMVGIITAGSQRSAMTMQTTCARPLALGAEEARALLV